MEARTKLEIVRNLAVARADFFARAAMYRRRDQLTRPFMDTEIAFLDTIARVTQQPVTITFPISIPSNFMEPVPVLPTQQQIADEVIDHISSSQQTCSICQDSIVSDGVKLRVCQHVYHRTCIQTWFGASVRCPVCRRDIREDPSVQTSSDATETQLQSMSQSEEDDIPE